MNNERYIEDEYGNTEEDREILEEIKGRSFRVCQEHYDKRVNRGIVSTDEIAPKNECSLCNKNKL